MSTEFIPKRVLAAACAGALVTMAGCGSGENAKDPVYAAPGIALLSSKADYVSGGDALVDITVP
ncbi:MAG: hypothetical protein K2X55_30220, partial [Burkholderiaceae bacterium]|nr:hypothetical protein [Burkholderiaceae bacterium]